MTSHEIELKIERILKSYALNLRPYETKEKATSEIMKLINKK